MALARGSEWRRWDLHVHSPLSILNNQFSRVAGTNTPDWEAYVSALEAQPIAVVGVTDYFTIEGYKELKARQQAGRLQGKRLLANVEFRLDQLVSSKHDKPPRRLNLHVIFSDDVSIEDLEDHFLRELKFVYENDPVEASKTHSLKPANLAKLGEMLIKQDTGFAGQPPLEVGAKTAVVPLASILGILQNDDRFEDKYVIVLPADGWDDISWTGQDHLVRKLLLQSSDCVFASNPNTIAWCLARPPYTDGEEQFRDEFGTLKPCIHGSDAHSLSEIGHPCSRRGASGHSCQADPALCDLRNCWIKADPTFEGLRQVLFEPADRVRIQQGDPRRVRPSSASPTWPSPTRS